MDGMTLLEEAKKAGLTVTANGDRLVIRGPRRAEPVVQKLLAHKPDVLRALTRQEYQVDSLGPVELPIDWWMVWDERAAIMEYDSGLPRERAEALALAEVLRLMKVPGANHATDS